MKAFIDTSSLCKRYILTESGSSQLEELLMRIDAIAVSPTYIIEMNSIVARLLRDKNITAVQARVITKEVEKDYQCFEHVAWSGELEDRGVEMIHTYRLKTLDAIQAASARIAKAEIYVTSDMKLYDVFKKEFKHVQFI